MIHAPIFGPYPREREKKPPVCKTAAPDAPINKNYIYQYINYLYTNAPLAHWCARSVRLRCVLLYPSISIKNSYLPLCGAAGALTVRFTLAETEFCKALICMKKTTLENTGAASAPCFHIGGYFFGAPSAPNLTPPPLKRRPPMTDTPACAVCSRPLTNPISIIRGIGPQCAAEYIATQRANANEPDLFTQAPIYMLDLIGGVLVIDDLSGDTPAPSVTNSIALVMADIRAKVPAIPRNIVYRDTDGRWDRIEHNNGRFLRFAALHNRANISTAKQATAAALGLKPPIQETSQ